MSILSWIILGAIAGFIAKYLVPGDIPGGTLGIIGFGIAGALLGRGIGALIALGASGGIGFFAIVLGVLGTVALLIGYRKLNQ